MTLEGALPPLGSLELPVGNECPRTSLVQGVGQTAF